MVSVVLPQEARELMLGPVFRFAVGTLRLSCQFDPLAGYHIASTVGKPAPTSSCLALELLPAAFDDMRVHARFRGIFALSGILAGLVDLALISFTAAETCISDD